MQGLIFFAALIMFLGSRHQIRRALIISFRDRARRLSAIRIINAIETALGFYFATAALLYAVAGLIMTVIAWAGGLSSPIVWGFFTFLSSFVPFLGVTGMTLALAIGGLLTHDNILLGLAPAMGFFAVHALMENLVTRLSWDGGWRSTLRGVRRHHLLDLAMGCRGRDAGPAALADQHGDCPGADAQPEVQAPPAG